MNGNHVANHLSESFIETDQLSVDTETDQMKREADQIVEKSGSSSSSACVCEKCCCITPMKRKAKRERGVVVENHHITCGHYAVQSQGGGTCGRKTWKKDVRRRTCLCESPFAPGPHASKYASKGRKLAPQNPSGNTLRYPLKHNSEFACISRAVDAFFSCLPLYILPPRWTNKLK